MRDIWRAGLAVAVAVFTATACGSAADTDGSGAAPKGTGAPCATRHEVKPIADRFDVFGPISATEWCAVNLYTGRSEVPGPEDTRLVGRLTPADADRLGKLVRDARWRFHAAKLPVLPAAISQGLSGASDDWVTSGDFDDSVSGGLYTAGFFISRSTRTVVFDTVNPSTKDSEGSVVVE
jgi:hypothetical protein